jgi:hypothetical protein
MLIDRETRTSFEKILLQCIFGNETFHVVSNIKIVQDKSLSVKAIFRMRSRFEIERTLRDQ